jgi:hypothetical protein
MLKVGPVSDILTYILPCLGFLSLSGVTGQQPRKQSFSVPLVWFLAGYSTEWFVSVLGNLTKPTGKRWEGSSAFKQSEETFVVSCV